MLGEDNEASAATKLTATSPFTGPLLYAERPLGSVRLCQQQDSVEGTPFLDAVSGLTERGTGVSGISRSGTGVYGNGGGFGVRAEGEVGLATAGPDVDALFGGSAAVRFDTNRPLRNGAPIDATTPGVVGTLAVGDTPTLWYCYDRNRWQRVAGPDTAGAHTAIPTTRTFDSRITNSVDKLVGGVTYSVNYENGYDDRTGEPLGQIVPTFATALTYNLTIAQTEGTGFVRIGPDNGQPPRDSAINWSQDNLIAANSGVVALDPRNNTNEEYLALTFEIGGTGQAAVILDVTGYYL